MYSIDIHTYVYLRGFDSIFKCTLKTRYCRMINALEHWRDVYSWLPFLS